MIQSKRFCLDKGKKKRKIIKKNKTKKLKRLCSIDFDYPRAPEKRKRNPFSLSLSLSPEP